MAMEGLLQPTHLIIILVIVLVIFGPGKLAGLGGALGKGIKEFKEAVKPESDTPNNAPTDKKVGENKSQRWLPHYSRRDRKHPFLGSSMVEHSAVNRRVPGSSPGRGANFSGRSAVNSLADEFQISSPGRGAKASFS